MEEAGLDRQLQLKQTVNSDGKHGGLYLGKERIQKAHLLCNGNFKYGIFPHKVCSEAAKL